METIKRLTTVDELFQLDHVPLGMLMASTDPSLVEILGYAGFDFVLIDNEHGPIDPVIATQMVRSAELSGLLPLVRIVENDPALISKMLDAGVRGIVLTHAESAEGVAAAIQATRFAPHGPRGWCPSTHAGRYSIEYWSRRSDELTGEIRVMPLIESVRGVENLEEILDVPGVECILFGPGDLSHELGAAWQADAQGRPTGPIVEYIDRILSTCRRKSKRVIGFPFPRLDLASAQLQIDAGVDAICYGMDLLLFDSLCRDARAQMAGLRRKAVGPAAAG